MNKILLVFLALLLAGSMAPASPPPAPQDGSGSEPELTDELVQKLSGLWRDGRRQYNDGRYQESIDAFQEFLKLLPKSDQFKPHRMNAHYYLASDYSILNQKSEALGHLASALEYGFQVEDVAKDPDLVPLQNEARYKKLIDKYRKIAEEKLQKFDFEVTTLIGGEKISKEDFLGKVLVVDLWGTWCPPCRMEIPHFIELQKKYGEKGLQIVGLNSERAPPDRAAEIVKDFIDRQGINYPCALVSDEILASVPDFSGFPTTLFIGRDGRVRKKMVGYHPLEDLENVIRPLLAEKPPAGKETEEEQKEKKDGEKEKKEATS